MTMETAQPKPPNRTLGWLLALPLGLVIAFAAFLLLVADGHYFFGEFVVIMLAVSGVMFFARFQYRRSRRSYWKARTRAYAPARTLRQRYARGEISGEEFRQKMRDLRGSRETPEGQQRP